MAVMRFTTKGIEALLAKRPAFRTDYFDRAYTGLVLRVGPTSATWYYLRRVDGRLIRTSLGPYSPAFGIKAAGLKLAEVQEAVEQGSHPTAEISRIRAEKTAARAADAERLARTVGDNWLKQHLAPSERRGRALSESAERDYRRGLALFLATFGDRDMTTIRRKELKKLLADVKAKSGNEANRLATVIRQLFAFAVDELEMESSPAFELRNPQKPTARSRTLTRDEIRVLWHAAGKVGYPYGHALRLALCTGQRIGEIGAIRRSQIDSSGEWWSQQDDANKARRRIDVYLGTLARSVVDDCPAFGREKFLLSASSGEKRLRSDTWKFARKRHVDEQVAKAAAELKLPPIDAKWTPHDLRRTVRTGLTGWCRVTPDVAERVLNHAITGLRATYDWADYRPHVEDALKRWDAELQKIIAGETNNIVALKPRRRKRA